MTVRWFAAAGDTLTWRGAIVRNSIRYGRTRRKRLRSAEGGDCLNLNQLVPVAQNATPSSVLGAS